MVVSLILSTVNKVVRGLTRMACRIDESVFKQIPADGPLIAIANHVNFIEAPIVRSRMPSQHVAGYAKAETWENPILGYLFDLWGAIPLRRGEADTKALRLGLEALKDGKILAVAPEGTRSGHGRLQRGRSGVVLLALRSGAPFLPMAVFGHENIISNLKRLHRTDFNINLGNPFILNSRGEKVTREVRQQMTDEIMYQIAALLPPMYRGVYSSLDQATERYLDFPPPSSSNLAFAMQQIEAITDRTGT
jgi:1-acyl-sn-glycerol-3-phosphate acyltransferase